MKGEQVMEKRKRRQERSPIIVTGLSSLLARFFYRDGCFYACIDAVCSLDLTALEHASVSRTDENCYTLSLKVEGGEGR